MDMIKKNPAIYLGIGITLLFLALNFFPIDFIDALELKFYDMRMQLRNAAGPKDEIVLIDIDDDSIDKLGQWPWSRDLIAKCLTIIRQAKPKVIGLNIIYSEPENKTGLQQLEMLSQIIQSQENVNKQVINALQDMKLDLDNDRKLEESLKSCGNVVLPIFFKASRIEDNNKELVKQLAPFSISQVDTSSGAGLPGADVVVTPIRPFFEASAGIGHVNIVSDSDGSVRRDQIIHRYKTLYLPSFSLRLAAASLNVPMKEIQVRLGQSLKLGPQVEIPLTPQSDMLINYTTRPEAFKPYAFVDVIYNKIPPRLMENKIVLITPSASGIMNPFSTPGGQQTTLGEYTANVVWGILSQQFIRQPSWDRYARIGIILVVGFLLTFVLPRMKAIYAGLTFLLFTGLLIGSAVFFFISKGLWMQVAHPFLQLLIGYIGVVSINFFMTETRKDIVEGESAETNRMLGHSFQTQGMLDMAFDKFRKVPVDDELKGSLYSLALDYERKRQYNKAANVYEYIEEHDPNYKDVTEKKKKLLHAGETMAFGGDSLLGGTGSGDALLNVEGGARPTLGRYEVLKQLGKGAMGIVYLGQDPRINRTTAIKTFKFSDDFEPEEAERLKERFFREAESAGTLSHPNIVTIYDAGDEHDLAYIAMEFLDGTDFQAYTKKNKLLPMRKVIDYVADIAEGLDYAHQKGIIHRDIKPANVMLLNNGDVKITDFGIARITASSQTQTGVVKGTPHYMSPEQISGKKVDGRSDIFSLGAMLYQLLVGELPFRGESPAELMNKIMTVPHQDPRKINPKIIKPLVTIIDKALEKNRNKRYQRASSMAKHLRTLGEKIDAVMAERKKAAGK